MKTNNAASHLSQIMKGIEGFTKMVQTGEGLGVPPEKMDEFKKAMDEKGVPEKLAELKTNIEKLKQASKGTAK